MINGIFNELLDVTFFGVDLELGFWLSKEIYVEGFLLILGFADYSLLKDRPVVLDIIQFEGKHRKFCFSTNGVVALMR